MLQIVYKGNISSFEDLLKRVSRFLFFDWMFQSPATELFKVNGNISNNIVYDSFQINKINYSLRSQTDFSRNCIYTNKVSLNSLRYFACKVWNMVLLEIKSSISAEIF